MGALDILQSPDQRLRERAASVELFSDALVSACYDLEASRRACRRPQAVGLAAPQVGLQLRVVSLNAGAVCGRRFMVNPEIIGHGANQSWGEEGCMSIERGARRFRVRRWDTITVRFCGITGKQDEVKLRGHAARVVQHEIDHLDGLMVDELANRQAR